MITVITPTVRIDQIEIISKCLNKQTVTFWEWIIVSPEKVREEIFSGDVELDNFLPLVEPDKRKGDYYNLNKAWNVAYRESMGDLIVSIVDGLWFPPTTLEHLWDIYELSKTACVSLTGHQYDRIENGKPEHRVWTDPRSRTDLGSFYEVPHTEMELCIASFPRQAVVDVGGVDEEFDKYAALSEKEMMARMYKAGYKTYIDQSIEYRAMKHDRLSKEWDQRYQAGWPYYEKCLKEINEGKRLHLDNDII